MRYNGPYTSPSRLAISWLRQPTFRLKSDSRLKAPYRLVISREPLPTENFIVLSINMKIQRSLHLRPKQVVHCTQIVGGLHTHLDGITVRVDGGDEREEVGQSLARPRVRVDDHISVLGQKASYRRYLDLRGSQTSQSVACVKSENSSKRGGGREGQWYV